MSTYVMNTSFRGLGCILAAALFAIIVVLMPMNGGVSAQTDEASAVKDIDDSKIATAVATHLLAEDDVASHLIDVQVVDGVVTLEGTVNNLLAKERATEIAEAVKGVRSVVNNTDVNTPVRPDDEIAADVRDAIMLDPAADSYEINVTAFNGLVTLTGQVDSWQEKMFTEDLAKGVRGVTEVQNDLTVVPPEERTAHAIKQDIRARYDADVRLDAELIEINVENGHVNLAGIVGSAAEMQRAIAKAWVVGVSSVNGDNLTVEWWARDRMQRADEPVVTPNEEIESAVADALLYDPRVLWANVDVEAEDGIVTLTGTVDNLRARNAAAEDARNTVGVWDVKNYLRVRPAALIPNDSLETAVENALQRSSYVEPYTIEVRALNGQVFLGGQVHNSFEKQHAEDVASTVKGVVSVSNNIDFTHEWDWKSDWALERDVKNEFFWSPYVDTAGIAISVTDGVVTLNGEVETWYQRVEAEEAAFTAGARDVKNRLGVELFPEDQTVIGSN